MKLSSVIREVLRSLSRNKVRSTLTVLGIVIGIASFICVVGVGNAGVARAQEQLQQVGDNLIWVEAGFRATSGIRVGSRGTKSLIMADSQAIADEIPHVKAVVPNVDSRAQVVYGNQNWYTQYRGITPGYLTVRSWDVAQGAMFTDADVEQGATVCVLGKTVADTLFGQSEDPLGKTIRVKDTPCKVIGVLVAKGYSATGSDQDDFVLMPITTAMKRLMGVTWLDDIFISADSRDAIPDVQKGIIALLRQRHHLRADEDPDFNIRTPEEVIRMQMQASEVFTFLLGAIASISLIVGGVGIMNIMLVSVTQRTREIGLRLAIGATENDIRLQFLGEALLLSIFGGLLGLAAGAAGALLLQNTLQWQIKISEASLLMGVGFALAVGIFFGYYPANRAAQLDPVQGLRYE